MAVHITLPHPRQKLDFDINRITTLREGVRGGSAFTVYFINPREHKLIRWNSREEALFGWMNLRIAIGQTDVGAGFVTLNPDGLLVYNVANMVRLIQGRPSGPGRYISVRVEWGDGVIGDLCVIKTPGEMDAIARTLNTGRFHLNQPDLPVDIVV